MIQAFVRATPIVLSLIFMPLWQAILASLTFVLIRRYVVAACLGLTVMDGLDSATFQSPKESPCNVISISFVQVIPEELI